jgi:hypothetical protein
VFRRNKRRGSTPAASSSPAETTGQRSQADDDHSRACLAAANCLLYEADGGPDLNLGTDAEPEVISHAEATQRTYAKLLVSDFDADIDRLEATAATCQRAAGAPGAPAAVAERNARAADLCERAAEIVLRWGAAGDDRQRRRLVAVCEHDTDPLAASLGGEYAEAAARRLAEALAEIDAEDPAGDDLPDTVPYQGPTYDPASGRFQVAVDPAGGGAYWTINTPGAGMHNALVLGPPGSGKTSSLRLLAVEAIREPKFALWVADPTGPEGITQAFDQLTDRSATTPRETVELLREARRVVDRRLEQGPFTDPTPDKQGIIVVVDAAHTVFADNLEATELAEHVATRGGPVSVALVAVAPDADPAHYGGSTALRDALAATNCFAMGPNGPHMLKALGKLG